MLSVSNELLAELTNSQHQGSHGAISPEPSLTIPWNHLQVMLRQQSAKVEAMRTPAKIQAKEMAARASELMWFLFCMLVH